jgi:hypothetical protein
MTAHRAITYGNETNNTHECIKVSYMANIILLLHISATVCGHPQGGALKMTDMSRYYKSL